MSINNCVSILFLVMSVEFLKYTKAQGGVQGAQSENVPESCATVPSLFETGKVDVTCNCMQRLIEWKNPIYKLTVNQTDCKEILQVDWAVLQHVVGVRVLVFISGRISFKPIIVAKGAQAPNCSLEDLSFYGSSFTSLPAHAFKGLGALKTMRFHHCHMGDIMENAVANINTLLTVEFADSKLGDVEKGAFANLTALKDLAFIRSQVGIIHEGAINVIPKMDATLIVCHPGGVTSRSDTIGGPSVGGSEINSMLKPREAVVTDVDGNGKVINESQMMNEMQRLLGRALAFANESLLPQTGRRLILLQNVVSHIDEGSLGVTSFGYVVIGGNRIGLLSTGAIIGRLYNPCNIAAALLVANFFDEIEGNTLAGIRGTMGSTLPPFVGITNNTFGILATNALRMDPEVSLFISEGNHFCNCVSMRALPDNLREESTCEVPQKPQDSESHHPRDSIAVERTAFCKSLNNYAIMLTTKYMIIGTFVILCFLIQ